MFGLGKIAGAIKAVFGAIGRWLKLMGRAEDRAAGARETELERREAHDDAEKSADEIWDRDDPDVLDLDDRVRRSDGQAPR